MKLAAVKQNGWVIQYIINKGIIPSEEVQLAAVKSNGYAIEYIIEKGIIPSEEVRLAAVKEKGYGYGKEAKYIEYEDDWSK